MSVNWNNLRSWNGSQDKSFEELCCQLAASESVPEGSRFFRKGTPDAGVECFWRLPNGDEWGWQANYFHYAPGQTQWTEMNESVNTAISKHPKLVKYTICLPIDRSDARIDNQKTMMMKWDEHVEKWQQFAISKGMSISFEYWGQSELATRLSSEYHRGRHWFWFKDECLSNSWFVNRVDEAVANARDRYSPDINIDLPIRGNFEALGRTTDFFAHIDSLYSNAANSFRDLRRVVNNNSLINGYDQINTLTSRLFNEFLKWVKRDENYQQGFVKVINAVGDQPAGAASEHLCRAENAGFFCVFQKSEREWASHPGSRSPPFITSPYWFSNTRAPGISPSANSMSL